MPRFVRALLYILLSGFAAEESVAQSVKEFRTSDGIVRVAAAPVAPIEDGDSLGSAPIAFSLDTLSDLTALPAQDDLVDPLFELYFLDQATGEALRFPAKLSQLRNFLGQHPGEFAQATPDARTVAMVKSMSLELSVRMRTSESGGSK
jgi:hypothetical protein